MQEINNGQAKAPDEFLFPIVFIFVHFTALINMYVDSQKDVSLYMYASEHLRGVVSTF